MIFSKIIGVGSYLPKRILTNHDIAKIVNTSDEWITARTGIKKRHIADENEYTSDLATHALQEALKCSNITSNYLDVIIVATTTPDIIFPATAIKVQSNIGMKKGFAFDIQAVCSGFLYALQIADSFLRVQNSKKRVAVIGAETMSRIVDWNDRNTCILFGDGAGAVILEQMKGQENNGILDIELHSDGCHRDLLTVDGGISKGSMNNKINMNGREIFKHAITKMPESIKTMVSKNNFDVKDLDWVLLHQANQRITNSVMERLDLEIDKGISTIGDHANTSAASIPLALDKYIKTNKVKQGDLIALSAVGSGLTWGSALMKL